MSAVGLGQDPLENYISEKTCKEEKTRPVGSLVGRARKKKNGGGEESLRKVPEGYLNWGLQEKGKRAGTRPCACTRPDIKKPLDRREHARLAPNTELRRRAFAEKRGGNRHERKRTTGKREGLTGHGWKTERGRKPPIAAGSGGLSLKTHKKGGEDRYRTQRRMSAKADDRTEDPD